MSNYLQGTSDKRVLNIPGLIVLEDQFDNYETSSSSGTFAQKELWYLYVQQNITRPEVLDIGNRHKNIYRQLTTKHSYSFLPHQSIFTSTVLEAADALRIKTIKEQARVILDAFEKSAREFLETPELSIHITELADESAVIEWIHKSFRVGFNIEENSEETGYFMLSDKSTGEIRASGYLKGLDLDSLLNSLLILVLGTSRISHV